MKFQEISGAACKKENIKFVQKLGVKNNCSLIDGSDSISEYFINIKSYQENCCRFVSIAHLLMEVIRFQNISENIKFLKKIAVDLVFETIAHKVMFPKRSPNSIYIVFSHTFFLLYSKWKTFPILVKFVSVLDIFSFH